MCNLLLKAKMLITNFNHRLHYWHGNLLLPMVRRKTVLKHNSTIDVI